MKRVKVLFGQRRFQILASMAVLLLAAGVVVASGASFTSQSANAANVFSAGTLAMTNTPNGFTANVSHMVPADSYTGTITIQNTGTVQGHFYLQPVTITGDTLGFAQDLQLLITDGATQVYSGSLSGLVQEDLGTWPADASHTYTFKVTFPDGNAAAPITIGDGADNAFMGATTTADFNWTPVSVSNGSLPNNN